jgi:hydrophobe/amphiphile efflux-1 (HAE1) family protein
MKLTDVCIRKPVFAWMMMAATVVFGGVAAWRIGISQFPDVDYPNININATWEGAAPEVMEHDVVDIIEEAVTQLEGVRAINSSSQQGSANISVELDLSRNVDVALQDAETKVASVMQRLPRGIDPPIVSKSNPEDQPIMWVGVSGPFARQVLADFARYRIKEALQTVAGVGEITMGGYLDRNIRIWVDANKLDAKGLTVADVTAALQREHVELPAGFLQTQGRETSVRVLGEAMDLATLGKIVVRQVSGSPIYLSDVALIEDGFEDERRIARVNGEPAQGLGVKKQRGANAVAVADVVNAKLDEIRKTMPDGMKLGLNFDSTQFIKESVSEVIFELFLAVLLTGLVCWMFLGSLSSTLNVILAIPMSLMGTIAVIYFLGFTLNTFTLLALSLAVGIVVDDAIMVLENIVRHAEMGKDRVTAAREGTGEITFAALAATLAIIAIFLPVVFMKGLIGRYFMQFGIALSIAVFLSYLEAITLAPARCAQFLDVSRHERNRFGKWMDGGFDKLSHAYGRLLGRALRFPILILILGTAVFVGAVFVFVALPKEMVPSQDQSRLMVRMQTAVGSDLGETDKVFKRAEAFALSRPEVVRAFGIVGGFGAGVNGGVFFVTLTPPGQRKLSQNEFGAVLRQEYNSYPGVRAFVQDLSQSGFTASRGFPIEFSVRGPDWDKLVVASQDVAEQLRKSGLATDVDTDYRVGMPELRIIPNRALAADVGVSVEDIATSINALVGGGRVGKYSTGGRRVDVRVRLLQEQRSRPEDISRLKVRTRTGELVPLSSLVTLVEQPALQSISRKDRERAISVFANVAPGHAQADALAFVERLKLPEGFRAVLDGSSATFKESSSSLLFALIFGIIVSYMVLASQFNSFSHPVTVLSILPLTIVGALVALLIAGKSINIFSMIGLILLMGIAKKNSIILVDYANQMRERGLDAVAAMTKAGPVRLRPILMTSIATMMAAVPSALMLGPGGEVRAPMAIAVIGGLIVSTALSLLVVPAFYVIVDRIIAWSRRVFARAGKSPVT